MAGETVGGGWRFGLPTPYQNEDGDWWIAADDVASVEEARRVLEHLGLSDLAFDFVDMSEATLREGDCDDESAPSRLTLAYHFRDREDFEVARVSGPATE